MSNSKNNSGIGAIKDGYQPSSSKRGHQATPNVKQPAPSSLPKTGSSVTQASTSTDNTTNKGESS